MALLAQLAGGPAGAAPPAPVRILALGDSLTAGYGLAEADAFPAQLEAALIRRGRAVRVLNGGVSGDTAAGGRARLAWLLRDAPDLAIVALGANDALRGLDPAQLEANLGAILAELRAAGVGALLVGMRAPRNLGADYVGRFEAVFSRLAQVHGVPLVPFFLEGVAGRAELTLADGLHPNRAGVAEMVRRLLPAVESALPGSPRPTP